MKRFANMDDYDKIIDAMAKVLCGGNAPTDENFHLWLGDAKSAFQAIIDSGAFIVPKECSIDMTTAALNSKSGTNLRIWSNEAEEIYLAMVEAGQIKQKHTTGKD